MDLKIPPPIILVISLLLQVEIADYFPIYSLPALPLWIPLLWVLAGLVVITLSVLAFRAHKTTISPITPSASSSLITQGIYRYSRNPIYLGMLFTLVGGLLYHGALSGLLGLIFFVMYMVRYQIKPEETALEVIFGEEFKQYKSRVRRWL